MVVLVETAVAVETVAVVDIFVDVLAALRVLDTYQWKQRNP